MANQEIGYDFNNKLTGSFIGDKWVICVSQLLDNVAKYNIVNYVFVTLYYNGIKYHIIYFPCIINLTAYDFIP